MNKKQKNLLIRIIVAAVFFVPLYLISEDFVHVDMPGWALILLFLIPYLTVGYDILRKAFLGIRNGKVFDECFLMTVATVGAIALGEYARAWRSCCCIRWASCSRATPSERAGGTSPS